MIVRRSVVIGIFALTVAWSAVLLGSPSVAQATSKDWMNATDITAHARPHDYRGNETCSHEEIEVYGYATYARKSYSACVTQGISYSTAIFSTDTQADLMAIKFNPDASYRVISNLFPRQKTPGF